MQKENTETTPLPNAEYPFNLIAAIIGQTKRSVPEPFTSDHWAGLKYVLSLLDEREQGILMQRYHDQQPRSVIANVYGITSERVRQIEVKACRKLQRIPNWNYIAYGVAGYLRKVAAGEYSKGFTAGYRAGYQDGQKDAALGVQRAYGSDEVLNQPIESLNLSVRAYNCLVAANCKRIGDVVRLSAEEISTMRQLGKVSANEIARAIKRHGLEHTAWEKYLQ